MPSILCSYLLYRTERQNTDIYNITALNRLRKGAIVSVSLREKAGPVPKQFPTDIQLRMWEL